MKKILLCIIALILCIPAVTAQNAPQGMKYQAIARDLNGDVLSNQRVTLKINLQNGDEASTVYYSEFHESTTNKFGLFNLVIGNGKVSNGTFKSIPWSSQDVWMSISIMDEETEVFSTVSNSKLLAVPYAFHAGTAGEVSNNPALAKAGPKGGVPSQNWSLFGNSKSNPEKDKLGTTDSTDVVFVTNNKERLRITADGQIITGDGKFTIGGNLEVQGDSTTINKDLYVGRDVRLNYSDEFETKGTTINYGKFTVMDSTNLASNLTVKANVEDGGFLATFINTNDGNGDGLLIKLGKARANDGIPDENVEEASSENVDAFRNLLGNTYSVSQKQEVLEGLAIEIAKADAEFIIETALGVGNLLIDFLNTEVFEPIAFEDTDILLELLLAINGRGPAPGACVDVGDCLIPDELIDPNEDEYAGGILIIPGLQIVIPEIPGFTIDLGGDIGVVDIEPFDLTDLDFWGVPSMQLTDLVTNPLNNSNEFITFADKNSKRMGGIKAQSVENWVFDYLSPVFMFKLRSAIKSTVDKKHAKWHFQDLISSAVLSYKDIGVEYTSGNGDYAEWLQRLDPNETISTGDIVGVIGGKITKDLSNAEQVMAISHRPIVLGNVPKAGDNHLGNNVAFMGQIPVKIMGPVHTGDYIVGKGIIKGYGIAISPKDMSIEDFKHVVGRSWDSNVEAGPKMVNTVVGVHNGDYIKILQKYEIKFNETSDRLQNVEAKIDDLTKLISSNKL